MKYENQGGHEKEFWQKQVHVQRLGCMKSEVCLGKCIWLSDAARSMLGSGRTGDETAQMVSRTKPKMVQIWEGVRTLDTKVLGASTMTK